MRYLKTNTAVRITVGPFLDHADGLTPLDSMTVTDIACLLTYDADDGDAVTHAHLTLSASGGDNDIVTAGGSGMWDIELTAANVNFTGRMMLAFTDADQICPVFHEFQVLPANVYDSLFAGHGVTADLLDVNVAQWLGTACHAAATAGIPVVNLHGTGSAGVDAPANFEDLSITDTTGIAKADVTTWLTGAVHAATVTGVPVVQLHDSAGAGGINAPANFEDLNITDTTGLVRPDMANASGNYAGTVATVTTLTNPVTLANGAHGGAAASLTLAAPLALEATLTAIKGATWSGTTDTLEAIRDKLPTNLEDLNITDTTGLVRPDMANASGNYAGTVATVTTLTNPVTLANGAHGGAAASLTLAAPLALEATLTAIKGATWSGTTDTLEAIRDRGDAAWLTATGFSTHSAADVVTSLKASTGWTAGGAASFATVMKAIYGMARGKIAKTGDAYVFYDDDGTTPLFTLTIAAASRTPS